MNSEKFNMYAAAIIGSLLSFLLLGFFSELVFGTRGHHEHEPLAFAVEVADEGGTETAEAEIDLAELVANADVANGEKVFKKCASCHKIEDGANGVGPHLWGVVGRQIGAADGYSYSSEMAEHGGEWDLENLSHFLENPKGFLPGTKMSFAGIKDAQDRVDVISYLNEADGSPIKLADAPAETEVAAAPAESATSGETAETTESATESTTETTTVTETAATTESTSTESSTGSDAASTETATAPASGAIDFASGDAAAGEKVFRKCRACHKADEDKNGVGPTLLGVIGRDKGAVEGFKYSDAMLAAEGTWTASDLDAYLADPKGYMPGNRMSFPGLKDQQDRIDVITYLNEADGSPDPLN